jgi:hypothetical protein
MYNFQGWNQPLSAVDIMFLEAHHSGELEELEYSALVLLWLIHMNNQQPREVARLLARYLGDIAPTLPKPVKELVVSFGSKLDVTKDDVVGYKNGDHYKYFRITQR